MWFVVFLALFSPARAQDDSEPDFSPPPQETESTFTIPDVCGIKVDHAEAKLATVTRRYDLIRVPGNGEPGIVFKQVPSPGGRLIGDGRLQLFVTAPLPKEKKERLVDESLPNEKKSEKGSSALFTFFKLLIFFDLQIFLAYLARRHWKRRQELVDDDGLQSLQFEFLSREG